MLSLLGRFSFVAILSVVFCVENSNASEWSTLKPEDGKRSKLIISGKSRTYYRLVPGKSMTYDVNEPGKYRIITRADLGDNKKQEAVYTFRVGIDTKKGDLYSRASKYDKKTEKKSRKKEFVAQSRTLEMDVPPGSSTMTIRLGKKATMPVYFRVQKQKDEYADRVEYVAVTPNGYKEAYGVSTRENVSNYYLIDHEGRLNVDVIGPTTLKVLTRVVMDETMRGRIKLPVVVYEDGALKNTYYLSVLSSEVSELLDHPEKLPSRGETFYVEVPRGKHRYSFSLPENSREVILRFFIPEKHLKNTEG
ncbi:hypothetical protein K8I28_03660 [bacterium]|nr:hypothetical protein [bacterium]